MSHYLFKRLALFIFILFFKVGITWSQSCQANYSYQYGLTYIDCKHIKNITSQIFPITGYPRERNFIITFRDSQLSQIPALAFQTVPRLWKLFLNDSGVSSLEMGSFLGLSQLQELHLQNNSIGNIENGVLNHLTTLRILDLSSNFIISIDKDTMQGMISLEKIFLNNNKIKSIGNATFASLHHLQEMDLSQNQLRDLNVSALFDLKALTYLNTSNNKIEFLHFGLFKDLTKLRMLDMSYNLLTSVPLGSLSGLENLIYLNLSNNHIISLNGESFHVLANLQLMNIANNRVSYLDPADFTSFLPRLNTINVDGNKLSCSSLLNILKFFRKSHASITMGSSFQTQNVNGIQCSRRDNYSSDAANSTNLPRGTDFQSLIADFYQHLDSNVEHITEKISNILQKIVDINTNSTEALRMLLYNVKSLESIFSKQKVSSEENGAISNAILLPDVFEGDQDIYDANEPPAKVLKRLENVLINITKRLERPSKDNIVSKPAERIGQSFFSTNNIPEGISNNSGEMHKLLEAIAPNNGNNMKLENYLRNISKSIKYLQDKVELLQMSNSIQTTNSITPEYFKAPKQPTDPSDLENLRKSIVICFSVMIAVVFVILMLLYLRHYKHDSFFRKLSLPWSRPKQHDRSEVDLATNSERTLNSEI